MKLKAPAARKRAAPAARPAPWLDIMTSWLGMKEIKGGRHNPDIVRLFKICGHPEVVDDETAWCAATVGAACTLSGYAIPPKNVNLMARSWLDCGDKLDKPEPGCVGVIPRGKSGWQGHVFVVAEVNEAEGTVLAIGGNQGEGEVSYATVRIDTALGWRWPRKAQAAPKPAASGAFEPAPAKPATMREVAKVSQHMSLLMGVRNFFMALGTAIGGLLGLDNLGVATSAINDVKSAAADNATLLTLGFVFLGGTLAHYVARRVLNAYREGRYVGSGEVRNA